MKPMSPEEQELEELRSGLSVHYRAGSTEEPPAHLDAAIVAAARREVRRSRFARNWHLPVSIAAVFVIGVSLALMTSEIEDPLPQPDTSAGVSAGKSAQGVTARAMKQESQAPHAPRSGVEREVRPSRERSARSDREADTRQNSAPAHADSGAAVPSVAAPAPAPALQQIETTAPSESVAEQKSTVADSAQGQRATAALGKKAAPSSDAPAGAPEEWLKNIEYLVRNGKTAQAREQLMAFRKRYPDYRLPETLRELEVTEKNNPQ
jgi:resuscitation-promoting factor RpfA